MSKAGLYVICGSVILMLLGGAYWKVTSYMNEHAALVEAYERQALELNQAVEVNRHNLDQIAHIKAEHQATLAQLQGQLDSEATHTSAMEDQIARLQVLAAREPEISNVEIPGECPKPDTVVTAVLADPFGLPDPEG
jgi:hypothetical protein